MDFRDVFVDCLSYPFTNVKRLLTLLILQLGIFIIIPGIIAYGYNLRVIKSTLNGENELPNFNNVGELLSLGIKFYGVGIVYGIPTILVKILLSTYNPSLITLSFNVTAEQPLFKGIVILVVFISNIFFIIGLGNMVHENRFSAAFSFRRILELIKDIGWRKYLSYLVVFTIITQIIGYIALLCYGFVPSNTVYSLLGISVIACIFNTYVMPFSSRFRGLIYPINESGMEAHEEVETEF